MFICNVDQGGKGRYLRAGDVMHVDLGIYGHSFLDDYRVNRNAPQEKLEEFIFSDSFILGKIMLKC